MELGKSESRRPVPPQETVLATELVAATANNYQIAKAPQRIELLGDSCRNLDAGVVIETPLEGGSRGKSGVSNADLFEPGNEDDDGSKAYVKHALSGRIFRQILHVGNHDFTWSRKE